MNTSTASDINGFELTLDQLDTVTGGGALDTVIKIGAAIEAADKIYEAGKKLLKKADEAISGLVC